MSETPCVICGDPIPEGHAALWNVETGEGCHLACEEVLNARR